MSDVLMSEHLWVKLLRIMLHYRYLDVFMSKHLRIAPNPKYYFRKNANLKLFQKRLNIFSQHLKFFRAAVQPEIWYALSHDRAGEGHGSILDLTSQTVLHACSQRVNAM